MLTCHGFVEERVTGLRAGADDCVVRPCANEELLARIDALFRRDPPRGRFFDRMKHAHDSIQSAEEFRRPVIVLSVDVQGSSKPPASSREEYLRAVVFHEYHALVEEAAAGHGGSPVAWAGDGGTAEFPDPGRAVAAALEILRGRAARPRLSQLVLGIGIAAGQELLEPGAAIGKRTSQTHNRAGHFQKYANPNMLTMGREVVAALIDPSRFRERLPVDGETVCEVC
jgi:class 3 adenylate cyclase